MDSILAWKRTVVCILLLSCITNHPGVASYNQRMDRSIYLARIGYTGDIKPDVQTLRGLHGAHMLRVPFENLNIVQKRPILLTEEALWDKMIVRKRGGFCYELNGLFARLLQELGFMGAPVFLRSPATHISRGVSVGLSVPSNFI